jgi:hypothetical protein
MNRKKMNEKNLKRLKRGVEVIGMLAMSVLAFTPDIARKIFERDRGTCQCCGKSFYKDGVMVHASHLNHDRDDYYNDPDNGQIECIRCHLFCDHLPKMDHLGDEHYNAVVFLANQVAREGYHTWEFYKKRPEQKELDIDDMFTQFEKRGYDAWDFIDAEL